MESLFNEMKAHGMESSKRLQKMPTCLQVETEKGHEIDVVLVQHNLSTTSVLDVLG